MNQKTDKDEDVTALIARSKVSFFSWMLYQSLPVCDVVVSWMSLPVCDVVVSWMSLPVCDAVVSWMPLPVCDVVISWMSLPVCDVVISWMSSLYMLVWFSCFFNVISIITHLRFSCFLNVFTRVWCSCFFDVVSVFSFGSWPQALSIEDLSNCAPAKTVYLFAHVSIVVHLPQIL